MLNSDSSFYAKSYSPFVQAGIVSGISIGCMLVAKLFAVGGVEVESTFPWLLAATFIMFFAIFNSVISLSCENMEIYYRKSMLSFVGLVTVSGLMAWALSGVSLNEAGSYRWIFIVLGTVYIVFLSMMGFMKVIVEFAQKEEWNQPRIRNNQNRKRKKN